MDYKILGFYIVGALLVVPAIIIILDLVRISTFLFYEKKITHLQRKTMIKPIVGNRIYGLKNILDLVNPEIVPWIKKHFSYMYTTSEFAIDLLPGLSI